LPDALRTSDHGHCDDDQIWTMSVSKHDGVFHMLYTALSRAEDGRVQRTGHAVSNDLITWQKDARNPVMEPDPRWYETDPSLTNMVSWRDPKPVLADGVWHVAVNARENHGPDAAARGRWGYFTTKDFESWEAHPPLFAPGPGVGPGVPAGVRDRWSLVSHLGGDGRTGAAVLDGRLTDRTVGPTARWRSHRPQRALRRARGSLAGDTHLHVLAPAAGREGRTGQTAANPHGKYVVAPLILQPRADGSLACRSFEGWSALASRETVSLASNTTTPVPGRFHQRLGRCKRRPAN
jgi:hypothetical protein